MAMSQLEVNGAEIYAATISDRLIDQGHYVFIISDTFEYPTKAKYFSLALNKRNFFRRILHVVYFIKFIKKHNIQIVHAHSRASGWVSFFASRLCNIPMLHTAHGHQHVHRSKKLMPAFGDYIIAVCENIREQVIADFNIRPEKIEVLSNGIDPSLFPFGEAISSKKKIVSLIGRLSGPKGDIAYNILEELTVKNKIPDNMFVKVIGGKIIPERFDKFRDKVEFLGFVNNVEERIASSSIIIGSGRVAIKSLLMKKPVIAVGETSYEGLITEDNITAAVKSNFGDIAPNGNTSLENLLSDLERCDTSSILPENTLNKIREKYHVESVINRLEYLYQSLYSEKKKYEIPVLLYHRVIKDKSEAGKHGTYIQVDQLESHFKYLKKKGFSTITFNELSSIDRFEYGKKFVILTFDDGYEDNYTLLLPLLKKYNFKSVIYLVTDEKDNLWDLKEEGRTFPLLKNEQIIELHKYGNEIGAHTMHHPDLTKLSNDELKKEVVGSKNYIEELVATTVTSFAYPYGKLNDEVKKVVADVGFKFSLATVTGPLAIHKDPMEVRRIIIHPDTKLSRFKRKVKGNYTYRKSESAWKI